MNSLTFCRFSKKMKIRKNTNLWSWFTHLIQGLWYKCHSPQRRARKNEQILTLIFLVIFWFGILVIAPQSEARGCILNLTGTLRGKFLITFDQLIKIIKSDRKILLHYNGDLNRNVLYYDEELFERNKTVAFNFCVGFFLNPKIGRKVW